MNRADGKYKNVTGAAKAGWWYERDLDALPQWNHPIDIAARFRKNLPHFPPVSGGDFSIKVYKIQSLADRLFL